MKMILKDILELSSLFVKEIGRVLFALVISIATLLVFLFLIYGMVFIQNNL